MVSWPPTVLIYSLLLNEEFLFTLQGGASSPAHQLVLQATAAAYEQWMFVIYSYSQIDGK